MAEGAVMTRPTSQIQRDIARVESHDHSATSESDPWPYMAPVAPYDETRAAHGNIGVTERCSCGAERHVLVNGRHYEYGAWDLPRTHPLLVELDQARTAEREASMRLQRGRAVRTGAVVAARNGDRTLGVTRVDGETVWIRDGSRVVGMPWEDLREAAAQDDPTLSEVYGALLYDAEALAAIDSTR